MMIGINAFLVLLNALIIRGQQQNREQSCCEISEEQFEQFKHISDMSHKFLIVIGASKSGTTFIFNTIVTHPQTSPPITRNGHFPRKFSKRNMQLKEMHFFDFAHRTNFSSYLKSFNLKDLDEGQTLIEGTPSYILHTASACRMSKYLPNAKFIVIVKHPTDRAVSQYKMGGSLKGFYTTATKQIAEFKSMQCNLLDESWQKCFGCYDVRRNLITRGFYASQLKNWLQFFNPDQFFILNHDETKDLQKVSDKIFKFANLEPFRVPAGNITGFMGKTLEYSEDVKTTIGILDDFFAPYNEQFYKVLTDDFNFYGFPKFRLQKSDF
eukprot:TRINITY_DN3661_c0_g1_i4.p2 TRINITY_DN3661_c0_g1~~TRINITY_DN3661_c0_g1_i4.p2  ORF type:complete len:324 (-),score=19.00 TRINITY_DN3661_c0_g1_i4:1906-2877(-)